MKAPIPRCDKCKTEGFKNFRFESDKVMVCKKCNARYRLLNYHEYQEYLNKSDKDVSD